MTTVAIVTPWFDHTELLPEYRRALELGPEPDEIWIVDNGSDPPLAFATLRNRRNLGFCRACNQGLRAADTDIVCFLNNDVEATAHGWLEELTDAVEPGVLVGTRLRADPHTIVDDQALPYLDGWCIAGMRHELLELGGYDERLDEPAYYSDNLLCIEARAAGMTLREARVGLRHKLNQTARDRPAAVQAATETNQRRYQRRVHELLASASMKGA